MKTLPVYLILLALFALALVSQAGAQSVYLSVTPIPSTSTITQIWMAQPFCIQSWWGPLLCSEAKGDELHIGAGYKLDFLPAWLALEGKDAQGRWTLQGVAKTNSQSPGANFVAVTGPSLVAVLNSVTPSPTFTPFPATVTPTPPNGVTATPTATGGVATPTPSPQGGATPTPTPTVRILYGNMCDPHPTPQYPRSITIYGDNYGLPFLFWYCQANSTPDAVYSVPRATFEAAWNNGPREMLKGLGR